MNRTKHIIGAALLAAGSLAAGAAEIIRPQIGEPLRDAAVTRAPDGTFYLTGTRATDGDFLSNNGIKLWSSKDLVTWKDEGLVYDLWKRAQWHDYLSQFYAQPDRPLAAPPVAGIVAPRLQVLGGKYYVTLSACGRDVRWLVADKPTGPYKDGRVVEGSQKYQSPLIQSRGPGFGSLFTDRDGAAYLVWGPGYLAKLNEKQQNTVPESAMLLLARVQGYPNADWCAQQFDPRAAALFVKDGKYFLTWAAYTDGAGVKRDDSFVAVADRLDGPYGEPQLLIAGSGPVVLFDAGEKGAMVSYSVDNQPVLASFTTGGPRADVAAVNHGGDRARPSMFDYANGKPTGKRAQKVEATGRSNLVPVFDLPVADVSICRGNDGAFYLTGTVASERPDGKPDFENNDGIYLWKSTDLDTWLPLGKVWDIDASTSLSAGTNGSAWQKQYRIPGGNPVRTDFCRGVTAPEIHLAQGTFWLAYSMNGRGTGLLKSTTGKAEGPYEDLGRITGLGESPSLFTDEADKTYWLWGKGLQLAALSDDHRRLESPVTDLFLTVAQAPQLAQMYTVDMWDLTGPHLFTAVEPKSKKRWFCLAFSAVTQTFERANRDSVIVLADSLTGPYFGPVRMIPDGGQTSVFTDAQGNLFGSFSGADPSAVLRERPGIVPLEWFQMGDRRWPRRVWNDFYTERGPWAELTTPKGLEAIEGLRDPHVFHAPDGWYYFSASPNKGFDRDLRYFRARDLLGPWEDCGHFYTMEGMRDDPNWPAIKDDKDKTWNNSKAAWEPAMAFGGGTYWISCWFGGHGWGPDVVWKRSLGALLKSTSGKPEGPYAYHSEWSHDWQGLFVDDDLPAPGGSGVAGGSVYGTAGAGALWRMNDDLTAMDPTWTGLDGKPVRGLGGKPVLSLRQSVDGRLMSEDCGYQLLKTEGRYVFFGLAGHCSYDGRAFWANDVRGPYHYLGVVPRLGNAPIIQNRAGQWYTAFCQAAAHAFNRPFDGILAYEVKLDLAGLRPSIWPAHDVAHLNEAVYQ